MSEETTYTSESIFRHPVTLIRAMVYDIYRSRELAWRLIIRNISSRYRQSFLGYLWAFLPPIFTTAVFVFLNSQKILNITDIDVPYPVYVMVGVLLWNGFTDALNHPINLVNSSRHILSKISFPHEALILAGLGEVIFNFLIRIALMIAVLAWFRIGISWTIVFAPIGIIALMVLGTVFGVLIVPLGALYQDIGRALRMFIQLWFFITPVIYPPPENWPASLLAKYNPVSPLIITTRELIVTGEFLNLRDSIIVAGIACFLVLGSWALYRLAMPHLIQRMGK